MQRLEYIHTDWGNIAPDQPLCSYVYTVQRVCQLVQHCEIPSFQYVPQGAQVTLPLETMEYNTKSPRRLSPAPARNNTYENKESDKKARALKAPPDGGAQARLQPWKLPWATSVCFNSFGYMASFGVFQTYCTSSLNRSASDVAWIGSLQLFLIFFLGTLTGRALDAGYFWPVFYSGTILQLLGVFMTSQGSLANSYRQLLLTQGVCTGIGSGLIFCPVMGLVATWFDKHRVFALAFCLIGTGTGGVVFPVIVKTLISAVGFRYAPVLAVQTRPFCHRTDEGLGRWTMRVVGFVMLGTTLPQLFTFRVRLPPRTSGPWVEWASFKELAYAFLFFLFFCTAMFLNFWALYLAFYLVSLISKTSRSRGTEQKHESANSNVSLFPDW